MGYVDYKIGNVTISRVYFVEGLGHNLFSVGQFCDLDLEVIFRQHTCFICNLDGVDLLTGSRGNNLYTLSLKDMMASSPICLLSKASKTKSWLWHHRLSHLNFGAINHLARHGLVQGLPKFKFKKDHLCSACATGKVKNKSHKPKSEDTNQEKLYLLHMVLCGPMRVESTPNELMHNKLHDLSFLHVFGALCYPTNDSENLGKLQPKADVRIFIGYASTKKAFRIYNRRTRRIVETIYVDFDELTAMASKQSSSGLTLNEMTPATISSGLVVDPQALKVIAPIADVIPPVQAESTGSPSSTTVNQDAPSPSKCQTTPETQYSIIPQDVEEDIHDIEVAHMENDPLFGIPIPEVTSAQTSSTVSPHKIMQSDHQIPQHNSKWIKDHPLDNIIGQLSRPVSIRLQLQEQALFCYYDAFLTLVKPKTYKDALTQSCRIEAMQEELNEFERLENKARLVAVDSSSRFKSIPSKIKYANKVVLNFHKEFSVFLSLTRKGNDRLLLDQVFKNKEEVVIKEKKTRKFDHLARSLLIQWLPNDIYSLIDSNETAKDLWDALERQMRGSEYGEQVRKAAILYEYETFKAIEGEQLLDTYLRYLQVINDLKKCGYKKDNGKLNYKFLNNLQPKWKQYGTPMRQTKNLMDINIDALYNILKQNQGDVDDALGYKKKAVVITSDPLALVTEKTKREKKIASNLKFLNNLQPEWSRHVTIVHQTKDLHIANYTQLYDFLKYNQKEVEELKAELLAKTQDPLALMATSNFPMVGGNGENQFRQYAGQNVRNLNGYNAVQNVWNQYVLREMQLGIMCTELLKPIPEPHQVPQNDNNVMSMVISVQQSGETVEQHPVNFEET
nr:integrase, catalytic region, zinc finger, CCHC-type, peptidase aspartic, catalytic [Tanacetum cinerariifolium]